MLFLDTTILVDVLRGRPAAQRLLSLRDRQTAPFTSPVTVEELVRGIFPREEQALRMLLDGLVVVPITRADGEQAGEWRRMYAKRGRTLSQSDCLIAASAARVGTRLATGNPKDFPMISVEHWPVGL